MSPLHEPTDKPAAASWTRLVEQMSRIDPAWVKPAAIGRALNRPTTDVAAWPRRGVPHSARLEAESRYNISASWIYSGIGRPVSPPVTPYEVREDGPEWDFGGPAMHARQAGELIAKLPTEERQAVLRLLRERVRYFDELFHELAASRQQLGAPPPDPSETRP